MPIPGFTATVGVLLLLIPYALNLAGRLRLQSLAYQSMNLIEAGLSCYGRTYCVLAVRNPRGSLGCRRGAAVVNRMLVRPQPTAEAERVR